MLLGLWGAVQLVAWANRWYVTQMFARSTAPGDSLRWQELYRQLDHVHTTLLGALVLLCLAGTAAALGTRARRRTRRAA